MAGWDRAISPAMAERIKSLSEGALPIRTDFNFHYIILTASIHQQIKI